MGETRETMLAEGMGQCSSCGQAHQLDELETGLCLDCRAMASLEQQRVAETVVRRFDLTTSTSPASLSSGAAVYDESSDCWFVRSVKIPKIKIESVRHRKRRKLLALSRYGQTIRSGIQKRTQRRGVALKVKATPEAIQHAN